MVEEEVVVVEAAMEAMEEAMAPQHMAMAIQMGMSRHYPR